MKIRLCKIDKLKRYLRILIIVLEQLEKTDTGEFIRTEKVVESPISLVAKHRGERGRDKQARKINVNSLRNLKPFQQITDMNDLSQFEREPIQKTSSNSKVWVGLLVLFGIVVSIIIIWYINKNKINNSSELDNQSSDGLDRRCIKW